MDEKNRVERIIQTSTAEERENIRKLSIFNLERYKKINYRFPSELEKHEFFISIENIARIEALEKGKGIFYIIKRRLQIAAKYLPRSR